MTWQSSVSSVPITAIYKTERQASAAPGKMKAERFWHSITDSVRHWLWTLLKKSRFITFIPVVRFCQPGHGDAI